MAAADMEEDECELFNDDGFVYKRKKRPVLDPTASPPPDPAAEENFQGRMKKRACHCFSFFLRHGQNPFCELELEGSVDGCQKYREEIGPGRLETIAREKGGDLDP
ncbi:hypothetical protein Vadar_003181 [Vaccinium darrowii]|uniref:Uncharacterized protein n=1 Tax=Vaccinium darrowii TaxID=229202 RepID=A0ACB7YBR0_9ERIC|nr:hypothetical protein Vadar_003181 [Vaccinium darrowii]